MPTTNAPQPERRPLPTTKQFTGRHLVMMDAQTAPAAMASLESAAGVAHVARSSDFGARGVSMEQVETADAVVFEELGVAVVKMEPAAAVRVRGMTAAEHGIAWSEPEQILQAIDEADYARGYKDGVNDFAARLGKTPLPGAPPVVDKAPTAPPAYTWGIVATAVDRSSLSGAGIRLCVLDTGMDLAHPDFRGRLVQSTSFITGETAQDGHGHGTHCIGTSCGPQAPSPLPRYGVAYGAEIFAGKVLGNAGSGPDGSILAGIDWALRNGCHVISMSLGAPVDVGEAPSPIYERVGRRALRAGTLIVAAAGNESRRPGVIRPVGRPANSKTFMAVAAVDVRQQTAWFSCGGLNPGGGQVDIAGPGVDVYSSWPMARRYHTISGTSMATPHVAGIAALYAQQDTRARGAALWTLLVQNARRLALPAADVGAGLVLAP